jgi:hypothetical protein
MPSQALPLPAVSRGGLAGLPSPRPELEAIRKPPELAIKRPFPGPSPISRRGISLAILAAALAPALVSCGNLAPAVATVAGSIPQLSEAADKLALIAAAFDKNLPAIGTVTADVRAIVADVKGIAGSVAGSPTIAVAAPYVSRAIELVKRLNGLASWGDIGTAAASLLPTIAGLVGLGERSAGRTAMAPAAAEMLLRRAATR